MLKIGQQRRAFHEAGHAVAAIAHGLRVQSVSLPAAGASTTNVDRAIYLAADDPNAWVEALRVDIVVVLAGPAAQMWLRPLKSKELADDLKLARAWSTLAAFLASGQSIAELGSDGKIELTEEEQAFADRLLEQCEERARQIVEEHWADIVKVAEALLDRHVLDADDLNAILKMRR